MKASLFKLKRFGLLFGIVMASIVAMTLTSHQAVARQDTCPDGGDWKKVEWQENWNKKTYDADAGKTITDVCV